MIRFIKLVYIQFNLVPQETKTQQKLSKLNRTLKLNSCRVGNVRAGLILIQTVKLSVNLLCNTPKIVAIQIVM